MVTDEYVDELVISSENEVDRTTESSNTCFLGTITPRPTFINDLTKEEEKIMGEHFQFLKNLLDEKKLILAGPILVEGFFGVNILLSKSKEEAERIMKEDPSVTSGIMKLDLHPFRIFLFGKK